MSHRLTCECVDFVFMCFIRSHTDKLFDHPLISMRLCVFHVLHTCLFVFHVCAYVPVALLFAFATDVSSGPV